LGRKDRKPEILWKKDRINVLACPGVLSQMDKEIILEISNVICYYLGYIINLIYPYHEMKYNRVGLDRIELSCLG